MRKQEKEKKNLNDNKVQTFLLFYISFCRMKLYSILKNLSPLLRFEDPLFPPKNIYHKIL